MWVDLLSPPSNHAGNEDVASTPTPFKWCLSAAAPIEQLYYLEVEKQLTPVINMMGVAVGEVPSVSPSDRSITLFTKGKRLFVAQLQRWRHDLELLLNQQGVFEYETIAQGVTQVFAEAGGEERQEDEEKEAAEAAAAEEEEKQTGEPVASFSRHPLLRVYTLSAKERVKLCEQMSFSSFARLYQYALYFALTSPCWRAHKHWLDELLLLIPTPASSDSFSATSSPSSASVELLRAALLPDTDATSFQAPFSSCFTALCRQESLAQDLILSPSLAVLEMAYYFHSRRLLSLPILPLDLLL